MGVGILEWKAADLKPHEAAVAVCDISDDGLAINRPTALPINEVVRLSRQDIDCVGLVCSCTEDGNRYRAGIQLLLQCDSVVAG